MKPVIWIKYCAIATSFPASLAIGHNIIETILWARDLQAWLMQDSQPYGHKGLHPGKGPVPGPSHFRSALFILSFFPHCS